MRAFHPHSTLPTSTQSHLFYNFFITFISSRSTISRGRTGHRHANTNCHCGLVHRVRHIRRPLADVLQVQTKADKKERAGKGLRDGLGEAFDCCTTESGAATILSGQRSRQQGTGALNGPCARIRGSKVGYLCHTKWLWLWLWTSDSNTQHSG